MSNNQIRQVIISDLLNRQSDFHNVQIRPFVTISFAQSLDGCLSTEHNIATQLSDHESLILTHQVRSIHDSILIGVNTLISDNPRLNVRHIDGPSPRVVVIDPTLKAPIWSKIFMERRKPPIIFCGHHIPQKIIEDFTNETNAKVIPCLAAHSESISTILHHLHKMGSRSLMVEGGGRTIYHFCQSRLVDYWLVTLSPKFLGSQNAVRYSNFDNPIFGHLRQTKYDRLGPDLIIRGEPTGADERISL